jgi:hypothetical protein
MLLGQKISDRVANMRTLPKGIDQRSACRHPDWTGPDDLEIKIMELREITDWEKPIYVKVGGARPYYDTALAVKAGADVVVLDGMQGGTARPRTCSSRMSACRRSPASARRSRRCRNSACTARCSSSSRAASARAPTSPRRWRWAPMPWRSAPRRWSRIGDNDPRWEAEYQKLGTTAGAYDDWHEGKDPAGITTQDPELMKRLDPVARRAPARQLPQGDDAGGADHRARLRQEPPPQSRARGPLRADNRGGCHGSGAAGRHQLVSRAREVSDEAFFRRPAAREGSLRSASTGQLPSLGGCVKRE